MTFVKTLRLLLRPITMLLLGAATLTFAAAHVFLDAEQIHYRLGRTVSVWLPYWVDKNGDGGGWKDIQSHAGEIDQVSFFAFSADPNTGNLTNEGAEHGMSEQTIVDQVGWLHTRDISTLFTVTQFNHVDQMLSQPDRLNHLVSQILATCQTYGFDGVDIDFEDFKPGDPTDPAKYTSFIETLATALHTKKDSFGFPCEVVATVLPHTDRGTFSFVDYDGLGQSDVDEIRVMAYDEFYPGSKSAGASAPAPWVASVEKYLSGCNVPEWKFVLGVPGYGYKWPVVSSTDWTTTGKGASVTYDAAQSLISAHKTARLWSDDQRAPYVSYTDSGKSWIAFYEDAESWQTKLQTVVLPSRLNGICEWAAGFEDPTCWTVIAANLAASKPIYGAVGSCYARFGGGARFGNPIGAEEDSGPHVAGTLNGRGGREQQFENGTFYYEWEHDRAYVIEPPILEQYTASGGPSGKYGFPIADAEKNVNGTVSQMFENGTITQ